VSSSVIQTASFRLVVQCLNRLRYVVINCKERREICLFCNRNIHYHVHSVTTLMCSLCPALTVFQCPSITVLQVSFHYRVQCPVISLLTVSFHYRVQSVLSLPCSQCPVITHCVTVHVISYPNT